MTYYSSIILGSFSILLFPKLCWHIGLTPTHNTEYQYTNIVLVFRLTFIQCTMVTPFILHCFPFSLTGWMKNEISLIRWDVSMNCMAYTYYVTLTAKSMCTWLYHPLKLLPSTMLYCVPIQISQDGFMLRLICMILGCDLPVLM